MCICYVYIYIYIYKMTPAFSAGSSCFCVNEALFGGRGMMWPHMDSQRRLARPWTALPWRISTACCQVEAKSSNPNWFTTSQIWRSTPQT